MQGFHGVRRFQLREDRRTENVLESCIECKSGALVISTLPLETKACKELIQVWWAAETAENAAADHSTSILGVLCELSMEAFILPPGKVPIDSKNQLRFAIHEEVLCFGVVNFYGCELGFDLGQQRGV